jgi:hypothetical protein
MPVQRVCALANDTIALPVSIVPHITIDFNRQLKEIVPMEHHPTQR